MAIKAISVTVEKVLVAKLDDATLTKLIERTIMEAQRGDKEAMTQLLQLIQVARETACW